MNRQIRNKLSIIVTLGLLGALLSFATAIFTEVLIDDLLPSKDFTKIKVSIIIWSPLLLSSLGLNVVHSLTAMRFSLTFNTELVDHFLDKLLFYLNCFFTLKKQVI